MATGLGAFVKGAVEGYKTSKEMSRMDELQEREKQRFAMETERNDRERAAAARQEQKEKDIEAARQEALQAEKDADAGVGDFAGLADPNAVAARQQAVQSVEQKATASYDRAENQRLGIRPSAEAQTASVTPAETDILKKGGVGLYKNQKAADDLLVDKQLGAYRKILIARGEIDKAVGLDELAQEMKDKGVARLQKNAAAFVMADADPAIVANAVSKVYKLAKDGKEVDPTKSTRDPKTGAYSFAIVDQATGAVEQKVMNKEQLLTGLAQFTPAKLYEFKIARDDRAEDKAREDKRFEITTGLERNKIGIMEKEANAKMQRYAALTSLERDAAKGADQRAKVEAMIKLFPVSDMDPAKMVGKTAEEKEAMKRENLRNADLFEKTSTLAGLNPRIDVQTLANAARLYDVGQLKVFEDNKGKYTKIGDTRVALP